MNKIIRNCKYLRRPFGMIEKGFNQLYWGFLFTMLDFRIQGFDVLPDFVGYLLFASGFGILAANSMYFKKASKLNIPMIILSIFTIYERPKQEPGINIDLLGSIVGIVSLILGLLIIYYLFAGVKEMSVNVHQDIYEEADIRWRQYLMLQIAVMLGFVIIFIPFLNFLYIIGLLAASVVLMFVIMGFMKRCGEQLANNP